MISTTRKSSAALLLLAALFSATIGGASVPSSLAFASGGHESSNPAISDNDDVTQTNLQSSDQTATINSDNTIKGKDGSVTNTIGQSSEQNAVNIFKDNDFYKLK
jgi:hypothetical protein